MVQRSMLSRWGAQVFFLVRELRGFPGGASGKELASQGRRWKRRRLIPGLGRSLKEGTAAHSSILAWRIPWTEEPSRLRSIGS